MYRKFSQVSAVLLIAAAITLMGGSALASFADGSLAGNRVVPRRGQVRIPVVFIEGALTPEQQEIFTSFFNNSLDQHTFRNYWFVNSMGKLDARCHAVRRPAPDINSEKTDEGTVPEDERYTYYKTLIKEMVDEGLLELEMFDISGPAMMPDGWMDGAIIFAPGFSGAVAVFPPEIKEEDGKNTKPGPFVIAGPDAGVSEILKAFAELLGFRGNICLSILSGTDPGFPLVDAYHRTEAGWTEVMDVSGPAQHVLLLPALTTGKVYRIGGEKEYFLVENRGPGEGYDLSLKSPGIAVYHIVESAPLMGSASSNMKWFSRVINESPDGSYPLHTNGRCEPDKYLFRENDHLEPDYTNQNSQSDTHHPVNSNWNDGEPSDIAIMNIDTKNHYPIITAVFGRW